MPADGTASGDGHGGTVAHSVVRPTAVTVQEGHDDVAGRKTLPAWGSDQEGRPRYAAHDGVVLHAPDLLMRLRADVDAAWRQGIFRPPVKDKSRYERDAEERGISGDGRDHAEPQHPPAQRARSRGGATDGEIDDGGQYP